MLSGQSYTWFISGSIHHHLNVHLKNYTSQYLKCRFTSLMEKHRPITTFSNPFQISTLRQKDGPLLPVTMDFKCNMLPHYVLNKCHLAGKSRSRDNCKSLLLNDNP